MMFMDHLEMCWSRASGQMPLESGDSAGEESGVAFARKQVRLVARSRELHEAIKDALTIVVGEFEWPYVDAMLGMTEEPTPADVEDEPEEPVETEDEDG